MQLRTLAFISDRRRVVLAVSDVLYVRTSGRSCEIHTTDGSLYRTHMPLSDLEDALGAGFVRIDRCCIVSARAIHRIDGRIVLVNGETLDYAGRRKAAILAQVQEEQQRMIEGFGREGVPATAEAYRRHYQSFDTMPFAFADIEMVFNREQRAVDWIFRYGNPALAELERIPLEQLIDHSFGSLFSNMASKWLRLYERATLYGETLETVDFSPEIDACIKVTCFPTFPCHCGCILFHLGQIRYAHNCDGSNEPLLRYLR